MKLFQIAALLLVGLLFSGSTPAQAQHLCPGGPGPGEFMVSQTQGHPDADPIYLCMTSSGVSPFREPMRPAYQNKPGYMAAAHHLDTSSVWIVAGHKTLDAARKRALNSCNNATGGGCVIADTLSEFGLMYVAEDAMGLTWIKGATRAEINSSRTSVTEWNAAIDLCWRNSFGCKFLGYIQTGSMPVKEDAGTDYSEDHFPKGTLTRNSWAMVARPAKAPAAAGQGKSWLSTGGQNSAAMRKELLERCRAESGLTCSIEAYAANAVLVQFADTTGRHRWISAAQSAAGKGIKKKTKNRARFAPPTGVQERVDMACPAVAKPCRVIATYDASTPRMQIIE